MKRYDYSMQECINGEYVRYEDVIEQLESKWLRHEGGCMPDGIGIDTNVLIWYVASASPWGGKAVSCNWKIPLYYMVVPGLPELPKEKRWRAEKGETYFYIGAYGIIYAAKDMGRDIDNERYDVGNYFCNKLVANYARSAIIAEAFKKVKGGEG